MNRDCLIRVGTNAVTSAPGEIRRAIEWVNYIASGRAEDPRRTATECLEMLGLVREWIDKRCPREADPAQVRKPSLRRNWNE
jgi:hypothetical protein